ncbi:DEAD/DEAH box helicase [Alteromonas lipolytica]|uniref:DEAD-box ATP-dependent RNA helicase RhpA n=1 Tax=Alteromonas lipolytica TaxID=1856405 RepID=A0A1E8F8P2_9ALTE|nr:DEAD/DEAH box helicase [Alteromonas lipolytica]OFI32287.1 ATP-dependent RNA helicase RhlE [Alteromonas lipolytica]GGF85782.1 ATP-dependent RNA helicase RhlE [Alteromonas lipolytica]
MSFSQLGLCDPLLKSIKEKGYSSPSPIQQEAIPAILTGRDVLAAAQTGTGKTAGFALPVLQRLAAGPKTNANNVRALILTPTRELAAQVETNIREYKTHLRLKSAVVFGGVGINPQMKILRSGVDVLVATPGRLLDLYQQNAVKFNQLEILVLDEADRMLDMGFIHDIKRILKLLPAQRQSLLFSATFAPNVMELAESITNNPIKLAVTPANTTVEKIEQQLVAVDKSRKIAALIGLIKQQQWQQVLVFSRTKHGANRIAAKLESAGLPSAAIHGNKSQGARTSALKAFKDGSIKVLVATDIAARGIDISELPVVVNLDLPNTAADYVHRIGRTGRAGAAGQAWSLVSADELESLQDIERLIQQLIPRTVLAGFEPNQPLAETKLQPPKKIKKPKKPKAQAADSAPQGQRKDNKPKANAGANRNSKPRPQRRRNGSGNGNASGRSRQKAPAAAGV